MLKIKTSKKVVFASLLSVATVAATGVLVNNALVRRYNVHADGEIIGDANFSKCVLDSYKASFPNDEIDENVLTDEQLKKITILNCAKEKTASSGDKISAVTGLEKMPNLKELKLNNNNLDSLTISNKNEALELLDITNNSIDSLDLSNTINLVSLYAEDNGLETLTLPTSNNAIAKLYLDNNNLGSLDLSNQKKLAELHANKAMAGGNNASNQVTLPAEGASLTEVYLSENAITNIVNLDKNTVINKLDVSKNELSVIDTSKNTALTELNVSNNQIGNLDVNSNRALTVLRADGNQLSSISLYRNTALAELYVRGNNLSQIDLESNTALKKLYLDGNNFSGKMDSINHIDISKNTALEEFGVSNNTTLEEIDVTKNTSLIKLFVSGCKLSGLDVSKNTALTLLDISDQQSGSSMKSINISNNPSLNSLLVSSGIVVKYYVVPTTENGSYKYDLSGLKIIEDGEKEIDRDGTKKQATFSINNTSLYTYDKNSKILTSSQDKDLYVEVEGSQDKNDYRLKLIQTSTPTSDSDPDATPDPDTTPDPDNKITWVSGRDYVKGSSENLVIKIGYPLDLLASVAIDNNSLDSKYYKAESDPDSGNTILTIYGDYVDTLEEGTHTIKLTYDGYDPVDIEFTVSEGEDMPVPDTSADSTPKKGDHGGNTKEQDSNSASVTYLLPTIAIVSIAGYLTHRNRKHIRFDHK